MSFGLLNSTKGNISFFLKRYCLNLSSRINSIDKATGN